MTTEEGIKCRMLAKFIGGHEHFHYNGYSYYFSAATNPIGWKEGDAEYIQRKKWAQHTRGSDSSSLQWPTATAWQSGEEVDTFEARRKRLKDKWGNKTGNGA